jgi:hypothetical protein
MNTKGQGSIEYLLLIGAAILVTAIVISFVANSINPVESSGNQAKWNYLCDTLDSNIEDCWCYYNNTEYTNSEICCAKNDSLLKEGWDC